MAIISAVEMAASMKPSMTLMRKIDFYVVGRIDSRLRRHKLLFIMDKSELTVDARFLVFLLCCTFKKKRRILERMGRMKGKHTEIEAFKDALDFITTNMVELPNEEEHNTFATIHAPLTNPGLACYLIMCISDDKTIEKFLSLQEATQIRLSPDLMARNKEKMTRLWEEDIEKTTHESNKTSWRFKNQEKNPLGKKMFNERRFLSLARDTYDLCNLTIEGVTISPEDESVGYTEAEILNWLSLL